MRGTFFVKHFSDLKTRFIPARAGNIVSLSFAMFLITVHPRACGEHGINADGTPSGCFTPSAGSATFTSCSAGNYQFGNGSNGSANCTTLPTNVATANAAPVPSDVATANAAQQATNAAAANSVPSSGINGSITNSQLSTAAANTLKGNGTSSSGTPTDLTVANVLNLLNLNGLTGYAAANFDLTGSAVTSGNAANSTAASTYVHLSGGATNNAAQAVAATNSNNASAANAVPWSGVASIPADVSALNAAQLVGKTWATPGTIGGTTAGAANYTQVEMAALNGGAGNFQSLKILGVSVSTGVTNAVYTQCGAGNHSVGSGSNGSQNCVADSTIAAVNAAGMATLATAATNSNNATTWAGVTYAGPYASTAYANAAGNVVDGGSTTSSATPTPAIGTLGKNIYYELTALAAAATAGAPTGSPQNGQMLEFVITDNGTARSLSWGAAYVGTTTVALPTTTVISKQLRVLFQYSTSNSRNAWFCIASVEE